MIWQLLVFILLPLIATSRLTVQTVKEGDVFQINDYKSNSQEHAVLERLPGGGFIAVWHDEQDGSSDGIYFQMYSKDGSREGEETRVNTYTQSHQRYPSVAVLSDGCFVVAWHSNGQDGDSFGIFGQLFSSNGIPKGDEFMVNTITESNQLYPEVSATAGGFVIIWQSSGTHEKGIYGQLFTIDGTRSGGEFPIATRNHDALYHVAPSMSSLTSGGFVIVWKDRAEGIFSVSYDSQAKVTHQPNKVADSGEYHVIGLQDKGLEGGYIITLSTNGKLFTYMRMADGDEIGIGSFQIDTAFVTTEVQSGENPTAVSSKPGGGFTVIWRDTIGNLKGVIYAPVEEVTLNGVPYADGVIEIAGTSEEMGFPSISVLADDERSIVLWQTGSFGEGFDVWGQLLAPELPTTAVPVPTAVPTALPTATPTETPAIPTTAPTSIPTIIPTGVPSPSPVTSLPSPQPPSSIPAVIAQEEQDDSNLSELLAIIIPICGGIVLIVVGCLFLRRNQLRMNGQYHLNKSQALDLRFEEGLEKGPSFSSSGSQETAIVTPAPPGFKESCSSSTSSSSDDELDERTPMIPARRISVKRPRDPTNMNTQPTPVVDPSDVVIFDF